MNETQVNAQFAALCDQRNAAQNALVNMSGDLAVARGEIEILKNQLEAATALVAEKATVVDAPTEEPTNE